MRESRRVQWGLDWIIKGGWIQLCVWNYDNCLPIYTLLFLTLPWLQQTPGVSLLPFPCWCSLLPFLSSCPIPFVPLSLCLALWSLSASVPSLLFPSIASLTYLSFVHCLVAFPPPLLCEHKNIYSAQDSADRLASPSCLPGRSTPALPPHCPGALPSTSNFMPWPHIKLDVKKLPCQCQGLTCEQML